MERLCKNGDKFANKWVISPLNLGRFLSYIGEGFRKIQPSWQIKDNAHKLWLEINVKKFIENHKNPWTMGEKNFWNVYIWRAYHNSRKYKIQPSFRIS